MPTQLPLPIEINNPMSATIGEGFGHDHPHYGGAGFTWTSKAVLNARRARAEAIADIAAAVAPLLNRKPSGTTLVTAANDADRNNILTRPERLALVERDLLYRLLGANN